MASFEPQRSELLKEFLQLRENVIQSYWQLLDLPGFSSKHRFARPCTQAFCQLLIDYTSFGHFRAYEQLFSKKSNSQHQYELLLDTTEIIVRFNDDFESNPHLLQTETQKEILSTLGEALAKRLELEDWFIETTPTTLPL